MESEPGRDHALDYADLSEPELAAELTKACGEVWDAQDSLIAARTRRVAIMNEIKSRFGDRLLDLLP